MRSFFSPYFLFFSFLFFSFLFFSFLFFSFLFFSFLFFSFLLFYSILFYSIRFSSSILFYLNEFLSLTFTITQESPWLLRLSGMKEKGSKRVFFLPLRTPVEAELSLFDHCKRQVFFIFYFWCLFFSGFNIVLCPIFFRWIISKNLQLFV